MTNAEAIEHLKNITIFSYQGRYIDEAREALDMAIKVLEAQELSNNSPELDSEFGDSISRQAAEKRIEESLSRTFVDVSGLGKNILKDVPSEQPEIIRCKDCKRVHKYHDPFGNPIYVYVRVGDKTVSIKADDLQKALDYVTEHGEEVTIACLRGDE